MLYKFTVKEYNRAFGYFYLYTTELIANSAEQAELIWKRRDDIPWIKSLIREPAQAQNIIRVQANNGEWTWDSYTSEENPINIIVTKTSNTPLNVHTIDPYLSEEGRKFFYNYEAPEYTGLWNGVDEKYRKLMIPGGSGSGLSIVSTKRSFLDSTVPDPQKRNVYIMMHPKHFAIELSMQDIANL